MSSTSTQAGSHPDGHAASSASPHEPPALAGIGDPAEKARVEKLIEAAAKEGALAWIGVQFPPEAARAIVAEFKRHYGLDGLEVQYDYTPTGEIIKRVEELLRTGSNTIDIVWTSSPAWYGDLLRRGEVMRYESPYYEDYTLSDRNGMSQPGYWVSDAYTFSPLYNPAAIEQLGIDDFDPTSWGDFADPRLAGHLSMIDVQVSSSAAPVLAGVVKAMGDDWLAAFASTKPVQHVRGAEGREAVGAGQVAVTMFGTPADARELLDRGIEVKQLFPEEGVVLIPFTPIILERAPHPSAARLFIDFVRSPHGAQTAMAEEAGALLFFGRPGVVSRHPDLLPTAEEVKTIPLDWDVEGTDDAVAAFREKARAAGIGAA